MIPGINANYSESFVNGLVTFTIRRYDRYLRKDKETEFSSKNNILYDILNKVQRMGYEVLSIEELEEDHCAITILDSVQPVTDDQFLSYKRFNCSQRLCELVLKETVIKDGFKFTRIVGEVSEVYGAIQEGLVRG